MDNNEKLFEGLLKADGIDPAGATESERIALGKMLDEQSKSKPSKPGSRPGIWRIIMKSKITKFAAAAVIIIAVCIKLIYWQDVQDGNKEIQIPPELAQMPIEKLLDIHNDLAESPFDSSLIAAALKNSLDKIGARQVLALAGKNSKSVVGYAIIPTYVSPVTEMVEAADIIIHSRVNKVTLDVSDLKEALLRKPRGFYGERFSARVKAEIELEVFEGYPAAPVAKGETLILYPIINTRNLDAIKEGHEYLILLKQGGGTVWMLPYQEGVYPVDADTAMVSGLRSGEMPFDDMWDFMVSSYEAIHEGKAPSGEELEYWTAMLQSDNFADCWVSLEYLSTLQKTPDIADLIVKSIEKYHHVQFRYFGENDRRHLYDDKEVTGHAAFVTEALEMLIYINDEQSIRKAVSLSEENMSADSVFNKSLPSEFAKYRTRHLRAKLKEAAQRITSPVIQPPKTREMRILANKKKIADAIENYQQDQSSSNLNRVINTMDDHLRAEDKEFIPFLQEHAANHWRAPSLIARLGDPEFVPVLLDCLETEISGTVLQALYKCGEQQTAIDLGIDELLAEVNRTDWEQFDKILRRRKPIIRFLGTTGDIAALPAIEYYLDEDVIESFYQTNHSLNGHHEFSVAQLRQSAVLALARLEGYSAIPRLKELYESDDMHIKILAALSLYYLGDGTGDELVDHFIYNTHRSVPEIEVRWHWDLAGGVFQAAMKYLQSPQIDALMLEKMRHGLNHDSYYIICSHSFFQEYKSEILQILVDQLSNRDRKTREEANKCLKKLTGQNLGFDPGKFVGQQDEAIERWQNYIKQYLPETTQPAQ